MNVMSYHGQGGLQFLSLLLHTNTVTTIQYFMCSGVIHKYLKNKQFIVYPICAQYQTAQLSNGNAEVTL